ncbi:unnamed protein product, partial [marine sediment metagenome]
NMRKDKQIKISKELKDKLDKKGKKNESYEDTIIRFLGNKPCQSSWWLPKKRKKEDINYGRNKEEK